MQDLSRYIFNMNPRAASLAAVMLLALLHSSATAAATAVIGYMPEYRLGGNYNYVSS